MKRILSLILAALLAASALVACEPAPAETQTPETNAPETNAPATDAVETEAPEATEAITASLITENGEAKAHIVVAAGADDLLNYGAQELAYHIKLVSGAELAITTEASADSLPIIIATPDTNPELNDLFADDLAWLNTLTDEDGHRWGSDGFAIRQLDGKLYIFGTKAKGALNGVYDFLEDNLEIMWVRSEENIGTIYDAQATISANKVNYREKAPFEIRGWNLCGAQHPDDFTKTQIMLSRNKMNAQLFWENKTTGIMNYHLTHNLKSWIQTSPIYDPTVTEYWCTDEEGNKLDPSVLEQVNFWSDLTADCIVASVLAYIESTGAENVGIGIEDTMTCVCLPMSNEPFEYAPGQVVAPDNTAYLSTVFFTFLNKIARQVKEVYPDVKINTYAYQFTEPVPLCEIEDNICICIAPILEDMSSPITDPDNIYNVAVFNLMEAWKNVGVDVTVYNYYGCSPALAHYERPIWDRIQSDLCYYVDCGFTGLVPEGLVDAPSLTAWKGNLPSSMTWDMNTLTFWLYGKLSWNPYEDVDALIDYFCEKLYGEAADEMREYYSLIEKGFEEATEAPNYLWNFKHDESFYFDVFVYQMDLESDIIATLRAAYDAAETDLIKERIRPIKEAYEAAFLEE